MQRLKFPIAVAVTSVALVSIIAAVSLVMLPVAMASAVPAFVAGAGFGPASAAGFSVPPELQGLGALPPSERFAHFTGLQVNLKDSNNRPLAVHVTPGTVTAVSASSLTLAANDGATRTFTLNDQTIVRGKPGSGNAQTATTSAAQGDQVVVVTLNDDTAARAVIDGAKDGFDTGPGGGWGGRPGWGAGR